MMGEAAPQERRCPCQALCWEARAGDSPHRDVGRELGHLLSVLTVAELAIFFSKKYVNTTQIPCFPIMPSALI